ncbi:glycosyltransferase family 4 protein [Bradyrhizobium sp. LHD-71]|uniref:glycosyltransferase family 4 protein n=1 Tax=Bradyrhizobium sp. LHD-71 TaxID=3072141 RepID=UPI0028108635|nr:glycosyltransferase family 4 protein [Bradyrhizobium sp. LHD-71]MDQ8729765.1 glycosyltransferase family 4 protein [Bradyrhizobium sp. LHD-71]
MNILMLTSEFSPATGGIGTYAREMAAAASALGARVTVIAPDYDRGDELDDKAFSFRTRRFHGGLHSMRDMPKKIFLARDVVNAENYDILHAADWPFFIPVALSRGRTSARVIMTLHGSEINETQTFLKRLAIGACNVFGGRTEIAANSAYTRDLFRQRFDVKPHKINAIPLGVSEFWFGERKSRSATRAQYDIPDDNVVLITVSRLTRRKGHSITAAAIGTLEPAIRKRLTWLIVGPDGEAEYIEALEGDLKSADCDIRRLGVLADTEIRNLYGACDFFCLTGVPDPSGRVEGFGLVYLEAAAASLPSVATRVGGVADAVLADLTGLLVEPTVPEVAGALRTMIEMPELRAQLAPAALDRARQLSWKRCAAQTYSLPLD